MVCVKKYVFVVAILVLVTVTFAQDTADDKGKKFIYTTQSSSMQI